MYRAIKNDNFPSSFGCGHFQENFEIMSLTKVT